MDFFDSPELSAFRDEVRSFLLANLPEDIRRKAAVTMYLERPDQTRWHQLLYRHGWGAPTWPREHGGTGWSLEQQYIFDHELAAAGAPRMIEFGLNMVGPLLMTYGSEEQRQRFLPRILSGEDWWCQGFSEPGAGSDLAALQCKARRDGDDYVINGTKIWTSSATESDMMFGLFRTDGSGKKQQGITFLLVDMKSPGLSIRPIKLIDGCYEVAQCFFDDVRVLVENRVGEEHKGWTYAKYVLGLERLGIAETGRSRALLAQLKEIATTAPGGGPALLDDPYFAERIAEVEIELDALEATEFRMLFDPEKKGELGAEASILKLCGTVVQQRLTELRMEAAGYYALPLADADKPTNLPPLGPAFAAAAAGQYLNFRKISIYGGSNEIQRNIVAKAVLGL
jgi:alkylation response protein AidB-like acyl-CoA dehydrogenase